LSLNYCSVFAKIQDGQEGWAVFLKMATLERHGPEKVGTGFAKKTVPKHSV